MGLLYILLCLLQRVKTYVYDDITQKRTVSVTKMTELSADCLKTQFLPRSKHF